jgi:hypothetical protein
MIDDEYGAVGGMRIGIWNNGGRLQHEGFILFYVQPDTKYSVFCLGTVLNGSECTLMFYFPI